MTNDKCPPDRAELMSRARAAHEAANRTLDAVRAAAHRGLKQLAKKIVDEP